MFGKNDIVGKGFFKDEPDKTLVVTSMFFTLQGEGPLRGEPAFFIRLSKCNLACSFCFPGNTLIRTENNRTKRIQHIKVGETVLSWDEKKANFVQKKVLSVNKRGSEKLLRISFTPYKSIYVTEEHPFLTTNGWVKARELTSGDTVLNFSSQKKAHMQGYKVACIEVFSESTPFTWRCFKKLQETNLVEVYNIEVDDTHTYIAENLIVHNCDTFFDKGERMSFAEINHKITQIITDYFEGNPPLWAVRRNMALVITGGEPLLQDNLVNFLEVVGNTFLACQVETNGTQPLDKLPSEVLRVVSPKCREKDGIAIEYLKPKLDRLAWADYLKFVMCADKSSPYSEIPDWAHEWVKESERRKIFISPMNIYNREPVGEVVSFWEPGLLNMEENRKNHEYAAKYCLQHGYILNLQIQLYASLA